MFRALIIGYGNPLRGDDGLGWVAAGQLSRSVSDPTIEVRAVHQLTPELAEAACHAETVIFIDAYCDSREGDRDFRDGMVCRQIAPVDCSGQALSHQMTPELLLGMAKEFYGATPKGFLLTLPGCSFGFGEGLSPDISSAMPALLKKVCELARLQAPLCNEVNDEEAETNRR